MNALATLLQSRFEGRVVTAEDADYRSSAAVWNGMFEKHPAAVVRCASVTDVSIAIRVARDQGVPLSVRGGGHQISGAAVADDALVIDLSGMRTCSYRPATGRVVVGGGALLGDLDRECARNGVAVPAGMVSHTGVAGLTLGGGIGWLCRSRGLTCDSLTRVTMVDHLGEVVTASESDHPDLFWAVRGGGGNFGVVTGFEFDTAPLGLVTYGMQVHDLRDAATVLAHLEDTREHWPRELQVLVRLQRFVGHDVEPDPRSPMVLTIEWLWDGTPAEQVRNLLPRTDRETVSVRRFTSVQAQQDHRFGHGRRYYMKPGYLRDFGPASAASLIEAARSAPPGDAQLEILQLGGAICDVPTEQTAFPGRDAVMAINVQAGWEDRSDDEQLVGWARAAHASVVPGGTGAYANFAGSDRPDLAAVFGEETLSRLREVKATYDPQDVFRPAIHIEPAAVHGAPAADSEPKGALL
ncbi:FAD/FMN-containing dehydrogenase [Branchiibius hedensis]|uniref:FAD/FMN-containing dehydrogenase n=1 Tax=Branchiibius hedensis TaxID=672460 RepID=A0A2Y8ZR75_9MICO|nr:FAD-binding oxidoreductase [Branchiibius hedensis]PWJ25023.1 FAD/FMN-containing dehydrogenase [Branchiibius hedensis]SSA33838.1 FAD/FMN-containing dehydrogenase [Branchiibius hedensis]